MQKSARVRSSRNNITKEELEAMKNRDFLLIKHSVIEKMSHRLGQLGNTLGQSEVFNKQEVHHIFYHKQAKLSKGEQLEHMPYLVLDYPQISSLQSLCSIRVVFWWGHYFTCQLLLAGDLKIVFQESLLKSFKELQGSPLHLCYCNSLWEHKLDEYTHHRIGELELSTFKNIIEEKDFVKLGFRIELEESSQLKERVVDFSPVITSILST